MIRNILVVVQMATMIGLVLLFWRDGLGRLAVAQACYVVATAVLFVGVR